MQQNTGHDIARAFAFTFAACAVAFAAGAATLQPAEFAFGVEKVRVDAIADGLYRVRVSEQGAFGESLLIRYGILHEDLGGATRETASFAFDAAKRALVVTPKANAANALSVGFVCATNGRREIRFSLRDGERVYGLGDISRANVMRRPGRYELKVRNNAANIPIPMLMSREGWGMLLNSSWYGYADIGAKDPNVAAFELDGGTIDFYLFFGRDYRAMLDVYTRLTGRAKLLPAFGYGISFVENQHIDQFNLLSDAARFREREFPCDVIGLEPGWMEKFYDKSVHKRFNRDRFNFPFWAPTASFTWPNALRRIGFKLSLWLCCDYDLMRYEEDLLRGAKRSEKAKEGEQIKSAVWEDTRIVGTKKTQLKYPYGINGMEVIERDIEDEYPEGALPWFEHLKKFVDRGARCFKLDGANQLCPSRRAWANGRPHEEVRNIYPVVYAKQMSQGYEDYTGRRSMVYSSGGWAGIQQYVATWAGDTGGGVGSLVSMMNLGASGHSNQTCDMDVDNVVSLHFGAFQPWSQLASWDGWMHPWLFPKDYQETIRSYWKLRYRLFPYLYTSAAQSARTGWPMVRMLSLEYPDEPAYDAVKTTYLLGDALLVSAFTNRTVVPPGVWCDYRTGERVTGPCVRDERLSPTWGGGLYFKADRIVPAWPQKEYLEKGWNEEVVLHLWSADATGELYEDDGDSLGYLKGEFARTPLKAVRAGDKIRLTIGPRQGTFKGQPATRRFSAKLHLPDGSVRDVALGEVGEKAEFEVADSCSLTIR